MPGSMSLDRRVSSSWSQENKNYDKIPPKTFPQCSTAQYPKRNDGSDSTRALIPISSVLRTDSVQILEYHSNFNPSSDQMSVGDTCTVATDLNYATTGLSDISNHASHKKSSRAPNLNPTAPNFEVTKQSYPFSSIKANIESGQDSSSNMIRTLNSNRLLGNLEKELESVFKYPSNLLNSAEKIGLEVQYQSTFGIQNLSYPIEEFETKTPVLYPYGNNVPTISSASLAAGPSFFPVDKYYGSIGRVDSLGFLHSSCLELTTSKHNISNTHCSAHNFLFELSHVQSPNETVNFFHSQNLELRTEKPLEKPSNNHYSRRDAKNFYSEKISGTASVGYLNSRDNTMNLTEPKNQNPRSKYTDFWKSRPMSPTRANIGTTVVQKYSRSKSLGKKVYKLPNSSKTTLDRKSKEKKFCEIPGENLFIGNSCKKSPVATNQLITQKDFCSENCNTATPSRIRSRRGQTISAASSLSTGFHHEKNDKNLNQKPTSLVNCDDRKRQPPKMNIRLNSATQSNKIKALTASLNQKNPFVLYNDDQTFASSNQSPDLYSLIAMGSRKLTIHDILDSSPFVEYCRLAKGDDKIGVIKIKNIPYSINRAEILAFLGRSAHIVSEPKHEPIHIIMERVTGKTLVCYVEFITTCEALKVVHRFRQNYTDGRAPKLGNRYVQVELSSQESLMKDLFPKAKNVEWLGFVPRIIPPDPENEFSSGFQGFVSMEELVMLVKHAEAPLRDCPQRPFECIISILLKYPWYMVDYISIKNRNNLHEVTVRLLKNLKHRIDTHPENFHLTPMLYKRVWRAALNCPGFSPSQKDDIVLIVDLPNEEAEKFGLPPLAAFWNRLWTIGARPGTSNDLIMWYIAQIREATIADNKMKQQKNSYAESSAQEDYNKQQSDEPELFGLLHKHIDYGDYSEFHNYSLARVARAERTGIERVLRKVFAA